MQQNNTRAVPVGGGPDADTEIAQDRVALDVRNGIAYVTLNREAKLNGIDLDMFDSLIRTARALRNDRDVRCVIIQGRGKAFSAGVDFAAMDGKRFRMIRAFARRPTRPGNLFQDAALCWRELPVPVIAVIHGYCFGAALQLALAADVRFTTPDCTFSIMETKWGLVPDMAATVTLPELIPLDVALALTMTAETFDGVRAKELGLVTMVTDSPLDAAEALAEHIKLRSPDAVAGTKLLFHQGWNASPGRALRLERRIQRKLMTGDNHRIARTANQSGQDPDYVTRRFTR